MTTRNLLSPDQVAEVLGVSTTTLAKWRQGGNPNLPYVRIAGRIRYRPADVETLLDEAEEGADEEDVDDEDDDADEDDADDE